MKAIYKGGQFQTGDFAQILTGVYTRTIFSFSSGVYNPVC